MKLTYKVNDRPKFSQLIVFAIQQLLAILVATIAVPASVNAEVVEQEIIVGGAGLSSAAALAGAGIGTIVYLLFTKFKSPVFLGSSFAFISPMVAAFSGALGAASVKQLGYLGLVLGAILAGLVYVVLSLIVKFAGVKWISKIMPPVVIGPAVAVIGFSLSGYAVSLMGTGDYVSKTGVAAKASPYVLLICALATITIVIISSVFGKKNAKLIPFVIGISGGFVVALLFTVIGVVSGNDAFCVVNFTPFRNLVEGGVSFKTFIDFPNFIFVEAFKGFSDFKFSYLLVLAAAYVPVAFVVFAEHLADHKNISSIIEEDLLADPGLDKTLLGDGIGSMAGAFVGGCPNTTYGESVACVALTGNASSITILFAAFAAILCSFISPFVALLEAIPSCVLGGVCLTLYGFIGISGLKMIQPLDLNDNRNVYVISIILVAGLGGMALSFGKVAVTSNAFALILGILANLLVNCKKGKKETSEAEEAPAAEAEEKEEENA